MQKASSVALGAVMVGLLVTACRSDEASEIASKTIGSEGGVIVSADGVLTIALRPDALDEPTEITIQQSDEPPDVYGPAYRVSPNVPLALPATLTYRHELPSDPSDVAIGYVDPVEFMEGGGRWQPLPVLAIEPEDQTVKGRDTQLSIFYALLDEGGGGVIDTSGSEGGSGDGASDTAADDAPGSGSGSGDPPADSGSDDPTDPTSPGDSSDGADTGSDTGTADPCADPFMGPYEIVELGVNLPGAEDLGFDGNDTFVARSGTDLVAVDPDENVTTVASDIPPILGVRFLDDGRIVAAANEDAQLLEILPNGTVNVLVPTMLNFPNGIYADRNGLIWFTDYLNAFVAHVNDQGADGTLVYALGEPNGVHFDDDRQQVFFSTYGTHLVYRMEVDAGFAPVGEPIEIENIAAGALDGVTMDECGNLYVVDNNMGGDGRLFRLFLDDAGDLVDIETIADYGDFPTAVANAQFATGDGWAAAGLDTSIFVTGLPGTIYRIDLQVHGSEHAAWP